MEIKLNKEIRDYKEGIFFGLSTRQFFFSLLAVGVATALYYLLHKILGEEEVGWVCILGAAPFAFAGFFKYHGMTAEQFVWTFLQDEILIPRKLTYKGENLYYDLLIKERALQNDENA